MEEREAKIEIYQGNDGEFRWRLRAANGEIQIPPEGHRDVTDVIRALRDASRNLLAAASALRIEVGGPSIEPGAVDPPYAEKFPDDDIPF